MARTGLGASGGGYFPLRNAGLEARREQLQDRVELTEPHKAALRLLRERVLENTRLALGLPRPNATALQFARIPGENPRIFLGRLLSDQNLMASKRRTEWLAKSVEAAIEEGMLQGITETIEILHELDRLDAVTWRMICSLCDEFYRKTVKVSPEALRESLWRDVEHS